MYPYIWESSLQTEYLSGTDEVTKELSTEKKSKDYAFGCILNAYQMGDRVEANDESGESWYLG